MEDLHRLTVHARRWGYRALGVAALFGVALAHRLTTYGSDRPFLHVFVPFVLLAVTGATLVSAGTYLPRALAARPGRLFALRRASFRYSGTVVTSLGTVCVLFAVLTAPLCGCTTRERAYLNAMKSDLRNLRSAQEVHREATGGYALSRADLRLAFRPVSTIPGVMIVFRAAPDAWSARATHVELPEDVSCVVRGGELDRPFATLDEGRIPEPGALLCDGNIYR